ncbi:MAG: hypothetical protein AB7U82_04550 [Blastocatellales bacterium]
MFLTLLKGVGTASQLLLLFIFIVVLFGIPLVLLALRLLEIISERRWEKAKCNEDEPLNDAAPTGRVVSTNVIKNA